MGYQPSSIIRVEHVSKKLLLNDSKIDILNDVSLEIQSGDIVVIQGASGSGKTTLLTLLAGLDLPSSGLIYFQDQVVNHLNEENRAVLRGKQMGFIFQSFQLLNTLTAIENVMLPLEIHDVTSKQSRLRAENWLTQVGLSHRLNHYPSQLSGGEQQRVAIARAFVTEPKVIFADEMTGNLDAHTGDKIIDLVFSINKSFKTTLVIVTHDSNLANRCNKNFVLREGRLYSC